MEMFADKFDFLFLLNSFLVTRSSTYLDLKAQASHTAANKEAMELFKEELQFRYKSKNF